jgi:hypothetical protein
MANTSPDLSQTLQNLNVNFPGATPGATALPPQSINAQIQALLKAPLPQGDKIARISDILTEMSSPTTGVPSIVKSSGVLDEIDFKPIVAVAPFVLMPVSRVWTKGNICYVSICLQVNPQTTFTNTDAVGVNCVSGLPPNPLNSPGANVESNAILLAVSRWRRGTINNVPFVATVAEVSAAGILHLATDYPLVGNAVAGYVDFLTISGHYPISLVDAVP